jgi:hypothetical protein
MIDKKDCDEFVNALDDYREARDCWRGYAEAHAKERIVEAVERINTVFCSMVRKAIEKEVKE